MANSTITKEQVLHIAKLANLTLSDEEVEKLSGMLSDTVSYIDVLNELNTGSVDETYQVTGKTNVFQNDSDSENTLSKEEALANAHERIKDYFAAKAVFER